MDNKEEEKKILFCVSLIRLNDYDSVMTNVETHISDYDEFFEVCYAIHKFFKSSPEARDLVEVLEAEGIDKYLEDNTLQIPNFNDLLKNNDK